MTITMIRRLVTQALVVVVALAAILTSGAPAQSLGDVARQEEARRKATANGKVYTNDDLRGAPAAATTPAPPPTRARLRARPPAADAKPTPAPDAKSEAKPAAGADGTSRRARRGCEGRRGHVASSGASRFRTRSIARRRSPWRCRARSMASPRISPRGTTRHSGAKVAGDRQKALTELDRVKKEIQQHTKALADLQEEARKAGVPPGWLR